MKGGESAGTIRPLADAFSGFVFKIQANMNPKHRDSMAFVRVCSGVFSRDMTVVHEPSGKEIRLARSYSMVAKERDTVDEAFPGDIVGIVNPGFLSIGDTIAQGKPDFRFLPLPQFPPEVVAEIRPRDVMKRKSFEKGLTQLATEGAVQLLRRFDSPASPPLIAAVGQLQFEVLHYRLKDEYNADSVVTVLSYRFGVYLEGNPKTVQLSQGATLALDKEERVVLLYSSDWEHRFMAERNPDHRFLDFFSKMRNGVHQGL
jgi:peptide chain release factor 3